MLEPTAPAIAGGFEVLRREHNVVWAVLRLRRRHETRHVESVVACSCPCCRAALAVKLCCAGEDPEILPAGVADDRP